MKRQWYEYRRIVQLNNSIEKTIVTSNRYYYLTEEEVKANTLIIELNTFELVREQALNQFDYYLQYKPKTWYRRKEKIGFRLAECWEDEHKYLTKEEFKNYVLYDEYSPLIMRCYSLEHLMKHSSANDFIKYMNDNGIITCPMIK